MDCFRRLVQELRVSSREAEKTAGISGAQLFVLSKLADAGTQPLSVNELAERTLTHQSSVSVVVSKLVDRGLVERVTAPDDRRRSELRLTTSGRALMRKAPEVAQDRIVMALQRMTLAKRKQLAKLLEQMVTDMGGDKTAPPMFLEGERTRKENDGLP
jgi:DNA-binding MarR family transcriptional regulator